MKQIFPFCKFISQSFIIKKLMNKAVTFISCPQKKYPISPSIYIPHKMFTNMHYDRFLNAAAFMR